MLQLFFLVYFWFFVSFLVFRFLLLFRGLHMGEGVAQNSPQRFYLEITFVAPTERQVEAKQQRGRERGEGEGKDAVALFAQLMNCVYWH